MEEPTDNVIEEREELMVSPTGDCKPTLRIAHFLKPTKGSTFEHPLLPHSSPVPPTFDPKNWPLKVIFTGCCNPTSEWRSWVSYLEPQFGSVWKRGGIYEAIMSSRFKIKTHRDLIIGLAEKWCPETNSFVFPWGEATVTLEDVIILGGFSVLGSPVFGCSVASWEDKIVEGKLRKAMKETADGPDTRVGQVSWTKKFIFSGSEIEHEAFLLLWLQRFVFNDSDKTMKRCFLPGVIQLAKVERIALAPTVLASIYGDLSSLKQSIVAIAGCCGPLGLRLDSQLRLVQLWAWERFPEFQPRQNRIKNCNPRAALWEKTRSKKVENVRLALDSARDTFRWRPYAVGVNGWQLPKFYKEKQGLQDLQFDEDLLCFALCLRVSKLVGRRCVQHYLPHRVAMQFGLDQDIPCNIAPTNENPEVAWKAYIRPFSDTKLYTPCRLFESDVTDRYLEWWKQSVLGPKDVMKDDMRTVAKRKRSLRNRKNWVSSASAGSVSANQTSNHLAVPDQCRKVSYLGAGKHEVVDDEEFQPVVEMGICDERIAIVNRPSSDYQDVDAVIDQLKNHLNANNHGMESPMELAENVVPANNLIGESVRNLEDTNSGRDVIPFCIEEFTIGSTDNYTFKVPGPELEARITCLERDFAELKASRFKKRAVSKNLGEGGCSAQSGL